MNKPTTPFLTTAESSFTIRTKAAGNQGSLPLTDELLRHSPSGHLFGFSQNVGMGWDPEYLMQGQVLILSTSGGLRAESGEPIALGFHTGHWELGLLIKEAALAFKELKTIPFAAYCSDPCDGRTQGTDGMMDSLPYRNTAAEAFGRLVRSLPTRKGVMGIATCDKGLPAMMMALAEAHDFPCILVPGGVTLPPEDGEDSGTIQSMGSRYAHGELTLEDASRLGCSTCATAGGGCQFLGTAASSQVLGEALGLTLPHAALAPSGEAVWFEMARNSAFALRHLIDSGITLKDILTDKAVHNAMVVHAAFGASTNLLLHIPAIAFNAGCKRPTVADWEAVNAKVPRIVDVLPNGPRNFRTVQVFLAGGVPEVMLQLRNADLLHLDCLTASGQTLEHVLAAWEQSERRARFRGLLQSIDGVDPDDVILSPRRAVERGLTSTVVFPRGNLAPEGAVVKSTAIDPALCPNGLYEHTGSVRVFTSEEAAIKAVTSTGDDKIRPGEIVALICRGPLGAGMPETAQITIALKYTKALKATPLITDGRFSGFSSGPCIGHIGPEALGNGPIGKLRNGDWVKIHIDRTALRGSVDMVGSAETPPEQRSVELGAAILASRGSREDLRVDPHLPAATRLWAALQHIGGGTWGGCVYDADKIVAALATAAAQSSETSEV